MSEGTVRVVTASGAEYIVDFTRGRVRRRRVAAPAGSDFAALRRDGEWVRLLHAERIEVGLPAVFELEPLGDPATVLQTTRITTPVVLVEQGGDVA